MVKRRSRAAVDANAARKRVKRETAADSRTSADAPTSAICSSLPSQATKTFACGAGTGGELGFGDTTRGLEVKKPRQNDKLSDIVTVVAGGMHCMALDKQGRVLTWGVNDEFALGRPTPEADDDDEDDMSAGLNPREATPTVVDALPSTETFTQVAAGDSCSFALTSTGVVYGWGTFRNASGPFAFTHKKGQERQQYQKTPMQIPGLARIVQIRAGADFALALDDRGTVWGWGTNGQSETGNQLKQTRLQPSVTLPDAYLLPRRAAIPSKTRMVSIHTGLYHAFAIDIAGLVWAWGLNNYGQTGIPHGAGSDNPIIYPPQRVPALDGKKIKALAGGAHHTVGLTEYGECLVWGRIDGLQTGLSVQALKERPASEVVVDESGQPRILLQPSRLPLPPCVAVAAGTDHSIAVAQNGRAYSWGINASGQCGDGSEIDVPEAKLVDAKAVADEKIVSATAGGQFSMFSALA